MIDTCHAHGQKLRILWIQTKHIGCEQMCIILVKNLVFIFDDVGRKTQDKTLNICA